MIDSLHRHRAKSLITRLAAMDLNDEIDRDQAVDQVVHMLTSAVAGEEIKVAVGVLRTRAKEAVSYEARVACEEAAELMEQVATVYVYETLEDWWDTTSHPDVISVDDQLFRDKPIPLKRLVLEAFRASRKARPLGE